MTLSGTRTTRVKLAEHPFGSKHLAAGGAAGQTAAARPRDEDGKLQELDGKVAVITGGGSGIGASLARACATADAVVVVDVNKERAASSRPSSRTGRPSPAPSTCPTPTRCRRSPTSRSTRSAPCTCSATTPVSPPPAASGLTDDEWRWLLGVNVQGVANGIRSFVPRMIEQGEGHIVNTGSGASFVSTPRLGPYCATKHAIVGLSEALRYELDGTGIGVTCSSRRREHQHRRLDGPALGHRPDAIADDFTALTGAMDETSLAVIEPEVVAEVTLVGVREGWPYIVMGPGQSVGVERRYGEVLDADRLSKDRFPFLP